LKKKKEASPFLRLLYIVACPVTSRPNSLDQFCINFANERLPSILMIKHEGNRRKKTDHTMVRNGVGQPFVQVWGCGQVWLSFIYFTFTISHYTVAVIYSFLESLLQVLLMDWRVVKGLFSAKAIAIAMQAHPLRSS
jgi:hypothetical protein